MKNNAIFISAGKNEDLASYVLRNHIADFDIYINIYESFENQCFVEDNATKCFYYPTTKFIALRQIYNDYLKNYETVAVFDDDGVFTHGSISDLPPYITKYSCEIVSPCQHPYGKLSSAIVDAMRYYDGDHLFRITNFIEMNFPVFSKIALAKYMSIYDGSLCGYGNDWWYLNILDAYNRDCCIVTDKVVVFNPNNNQKKFASDTNDIDKYMSLKDRKYQWINVKKEYDLKEWSVRNKKFIYEKDLAAIQVSGVDKTIA